MSSLGGCMKRAQFSKDEESHVRRLVKQYREEGIEGPVANIRAVQDLLRETNDERASILAQLQRLPRTLPKKATPTEKAPAPKPEAPKQAPSKYALGTIDKMYRIILDDTKAVHRMRRDNKDAWAIVKRVDTAMKESQKSGMDYDEAAGKISMDDIDKLSDILSTQEKASVKDEKNPKDDLTIEETQEGKITELGAPDRTKSAKPAKAIDAPASPANELADLFKQETAQNKKKVIPSKPRIPVAPITGGESVPVGDIILNLEKGVGRKLTVGKTKAGTVGTYKPGSTATLIKYSGDLDTTAHELSHALDDQYGLVKEWKGQDTSPFDAELMPFSPHSSQKSSTSRTYDRAEGVAEYLRAWVVNPDAAEAAAPQFTAHMKKVLPADIQKALKTFSTQVRQWAGNSAHAKIMANVQWETPETGLTQWLTGTRTAKGPGFQLTFGDQLATVWTDRLAPFMKAIKYASDQRGIDKPLPGDDPALLSRLFMGVNAKIDDIFAHGMVDSRLDRSTPGGLTWLMEPLDRSSVKAMDTEMQQVASLMIAQRTIEKHDKFTAKVMDRAKRRAASILEKAEARAMLRAEEISRHSERMVKRIQLAVERRVKKLERSYEFKIRRAKQEQTNPDLYGKLEARIRERLTKRTDRIRQHGQGIIKRYEYRAIQRAIQRDQTMQRRLGEMEGRMNARFIRIEPLVRERFERLSGIGAGIESDPDVAKARVEELESDPGKFRKLQEAASRYRQWADANLRYLVDKGRLSQEQYESIKANNEQYVAMQRLLEVSPGEELATFLPSGGSKKIGSVGQPVKTFEGSTRTIKNPYLSLMDATHKAIREADRNEIMKLFRDLLTTDRGMYEGEPKDLATIGREAKSGEKQTIPIFVNGAKEVWQFHPDIYKALKGIEEGEYKLPPVLTVLPRILRATIVNAPPFALRNIIRDSWHRAILSLSGSKPWDTLKVYSKDEIAQLKKSGGDQAGHYYTDAKNYARAMRYAMEEAVHSTNSIVVDPSKLMGWIRKGGQGYLDLMQGSERQGRLSEYRRAFTKAKEKLGYDDYHAMLYAAGQSRNLIDYAVAGNWMLLLNQMIPFSNAAVQGLRSSALRAKADPTGFALRYGVFAIAPSLMAYAWNALYGDGDDLDEYRQLPAYQRDLFWNFKLGPDLWLKVPKPFELGVTATTMERLMDYSLGNEKAFDGHVGSMVRTLLPVDEASFAGPYQAIFQAAANYDFFRDRPIVPRWEENLELDLRNYNRASRLGQALQQAIGVDARKIDFVIQQQFGYLGRYAADISDVGRKDRHGLTITSTGMVSTSPASVSLDARKVADIAEERGVVPSRGKTVERIGHVKDVGDRASKHPDALRYGVFRKHLNQYYKAESGEDRDKLAKLVREEAKLLRARWEKTPPREEATEKAGKKRAERTQDPLMEMLGLDYAPISKHPVTALHELVP